VSRTVSGRTIAERPVRDFREIFVRFTSAHPPTSRAYAGSNKSNPNSGARRVRKLYTRASTRSSCTQTRAHTRTHPFTRRNVLNVSGILRRWPETAASDVYRLSRFSRAKRCTVDDGTPSLILTVFPVSDFTRAKVEGGTGARAREIVLAITYSFARIRAAISTPPCFIENRPYTKNTIYERCTYK